MKDTDKRKEQLIEELTGLRQKVATMGAEGSERIRDLKKAKEQLQEEVVERKKIEERVIRNSNFLKCIFEGISDGLSVLDTELNIVRVNKWMEKMYPESVPLEGKECYQVYQKRTTPCPWCPSLSALTTGEVNSEIVPYLAEERTTGWIDLSAYPLRDDEGQIIGVIEHVKDITARKHAEESLTHLNAVLHALRNVNHIMITERDRESLVMGVCETLIETRGYHNAWIALFDESHKHVMMAESGLGEAFVPMAEQVKGGTITHCARKALSQSNVVVITDPLSTCTECSLSKMYRDKGAMAVRLEYGGKVYGLLSISIPLDFINDEEEQSLLKELAGDIAFALHSIEAEEKRKQAEDALHDSEEKYRILTETATDIIFALDNKGQFTYINPVTEKITGYTIQDLTGHLFTKVLAPEYIEPSIDRFRRSLSGETIPMYEVDLVHKDGNKVPVELNVTSLLDAAGKTMRRIGIARDITERKRAEVEKKKLESQLQRAQKMEAIGTLAGGIAHDFNNILSAVLGFTELAMCQIENKTAVQDDLQEVLNAGKRAKDLVKQILTFSRQAEYEQKPVQVKLVVGETLKLLRASLPTTIEIRRNIKSDSLIMGDLTQIHQIMMNLCTNAGHAMQTKGGILEVSLTDEEVDLASAAGYPDLNPGRYLQLTVSDTGHGMRPEVIGQIFDPFFTTKGPGEGTGLGLSVVHGIVKSHGGDIHAYSEPGKGTTFKVFFPAIERRKEPEPREERPVPAGTEHILFIDDEPSLVKIGNQMLETLGYHVTSRTSSIEALELFKAQPDRFDLVITDMTMPHMTGKELSAKLMEIRPDIPIILCTGFSSKINEEKVSAIGIRAFVMKPILRRSMAETIRRVLDQEVEA